MTQWYGIFAPVRSPAGVVGSLNSALNEVLARRDAAALFIARGIDVQPGPPEQLGRLVEQELATWRRFVQQADLARHR